MAILDVSDLKAYYVTNVYGKIRQVKAVDGVDFTLQENEIYGIAGESGCGKTTLLKTLSGLAKPPLRFMGGRVEYNLGDRSLDLMQLRSESERRRVRGSSISYIPQGSMSVLNPVRRISRAFRDFVGAHRNLKEMDYDRFVQLHLNALGLDRDILKAYPHQLSGGMRQRVTIALSTILRPRLILADEPSTALDVVMQRGVIQLLKQIKHDQKNTIVMVTHDMAIHANICDRLAIMYAGRIVEEGRVRDIFKDARHPYTQFLMGSLPVIGDKSYRISAPGAPPSLLDPPTGCRFHPRCPQAGERCGHDEPQFVEVSDGHRVACLSAGETQRPARKDVS